MTLRCFALLSTLGLLLLSPSARAADSDGDLLEDPFELAHGFDRFDPDQDGNGVLDGYDDWDMDGLANLGEQSENTDPSSPDTDSDGLLDGLEGRAPLQWGDPALLREAFRYESSQPADVDGDGDLDLLFMTHLPGRLGWYEKQDGVARFGVLPHVAALMPTGGIAGRHYAVAADLDGDGDVDVLSSSREVDELAWYENVDGAGLFGPRKPLAASPDGPTGIGAHDFDGDGDLDAFSVSIHDDTLGWYENLDGAGTFGPRQVVFVQAELYGESVTAADLDGDLDVDFVVSVGSSLLWIENSDGLGSFGAPQVVDPAEASPSVVSTADLDGDLDSDIVVASWGTGTLGWYENTNGSGSFGPRRTITTGVPILLGFEASDIDGDGDLDVVFGTEGGREVAWVENTDGLGSYGPKQLIWDWSYPAVFRVVSDIDTIDMDDDGDLDVVMTSTSMFEILWFENLDGLGSFSSQRIVVSGMLTIPATADVDGDGDADVVAAAENGGKVAWMPNLDGAGDLGSPLFVDESHEDVSALAARDIDGDGDPDIARLSISDDAFAWYENTDGAGSYGPRTVVATAGSWPLAIELADLDGDLDVDAVVASRDSDEVGWFENLDGLGSFAPAQTITSSADGVNAIALGDLDGDGDLDVATASYGDTTIAWFENLDANGSFGPGRLVDGMADHPRALSIDDLDGDGDADMVAAHHDGNRVDWYENLDGDGNFSSPTLLSANMPGALGVATSDVDEDGDVDVIASSNFDRILGWFENLGAGSFSPRRILDLRAGDHDYLELGDLNGDGTQDLVASGLVWYPNLGRPGGFGLERIVTESADSALATQGADLDGDGDNDLILASFGDDTVAWYENLDGDGTFGVERLITTTLSAPWTLAVGDLDSDGDVDVVSGAWSSRQISWHENLDGLGTFAAPQIIEAAADGVYRVIVADLDGDQDPDVAAAIENDHEIAWFENVAGNGSLWVKHSVTIDAISAHGVAAADLDGDQDLDLVSTSSGDDKVAWYENTDGLGSYGPQRVISAAVDGARQAALADLDGDGDVDVAVAADGDDDVSWFENLDAAGSFGTERHIDPSAIGAFDILASNLSRDGSVDIAYVSYEYNRISWFENFGEGGGFSPSRTLTEDAIGASGIHASDLDGDGDLDLVCASYLDDTLSWFENHAIGATSPLDPDSDDDTLLDGFEVAHGFDPLSPGEQSEDPDADGIDNSIEQSVGTDPNDPDTDGDGFEDGVEIAAGSDPLDPSSVPTTAVPTLPASGWIALCTLLAVVAVASRWVRPTSG